MIFFEHLFIVIARFYIKTWSKYKNWWVNVRYGITVLLISNLLTIQALTDNRLTKLTFMTIAIVLYLIVSFINPKLNDKEFVANYKTIELWRKLSLLYIFLSITICILTFWLFIVGI